MPNPQTITPKLTRTEAESLLPEYAIPQGASQSITARRAIKEALNSPQPQDTPDLTCKSCGAPTKPNGRYHPDLGMLYGFEAGQGEATEREARLEEALREMFKPLTYHYDGPLPAPRQQRYLPSGEECRVIARAALSNKESTDD